MEKNIRDLSKEEQIRYCKDCFSSSISLLLQTCKAMSNLMKVIDDCIGEIQEGRNIMMELLQEKTKEENNNAKENE